MTARRRILITRPQAQAIETAQTLTSKGWTVFIEPMLTIIPEDFPAFDPQSYQAVVFTSMNGVAAFARRYPPCALPVYTVGAATGEAARAHGFTDVTSAGGTVETLNALLSGLSWPSDKPLLHLSGAVIAGEVTAGRLQVARQVVYTAHAANALTEDCLRILNGEGFEAVLFFSPRTASAFTKLLLEKGRKTAVSSTKALCIADSVVKSLGDLPWQDIQVAASPDADSLLALLDAPA